ncbi:MULTISPECIES: hypothetical protein [Nocardia]|uniref:hypothetical protein n=1 Tax=Nocardia TaxID=1817 RepID=UPI0003199E11|nr:MULTISPECIES: hypothetical protein [Nocardia]
MSETTIVSEIVDTARYLGIQGIPDAERMTTGRVWPAGHGWVGEIGEGPAVHALDDMYGSKDEAIEAVQTEIRRLRDETAALLTAAGGKAAELAATRPHWQAPVIKLFANASQQQPTLLQGA